MVLNSYEYIPKDKRKNILLLSDDLRFNSGVGTVSRTFVLGTAHRFNWFQVGAAVNHPDIGKRIDISQDINNKLGITDSSVFIQPNNGYGDPDLIRALMHEFKFDAILHFTDPRQWIWLYNMQHELRQNIPILFYHVWDNLPYPMYNKPYYDSCDWIGCISKQTENIVKNVCVDKENKTYLNEKQVTYIPHGIDSSIFFPIDENNQGQMREDAEKNLKSDYEFMLQFKKELFGESDFEYVVLYNNRNIRRKNMGSVILSFTEFVKTLPKEKADKCVLVMHTQVVDPNGTDLNEVINNIANGANVILHDGRLDPVKLNYLYNISDVTINISSAEGFGLATAESIMAGTPIISIVTGGLQDQMGFVDDEGKIIQFTREWPTNSNGRFKKYGKWVYPIFPTARNLVGSPPTPYIFDDHIDYEDVLPAYNYWYNMSRQDRKNAALEGIEYMKKPEIGMEASEMNRRIIHDIELVFENWKPIDRWKIIKI